MTYLRRLWRGELSLARSFWVNVIVVNLALALLTFWINDRGVAWGPVTFARASLGLLALQLFLVTPWQIVGCWRSGNWRTAETGKSLAIKHSGPKLTNRKWGSISFSNDISVTAGNLGQSITSC